MLLSICFSLSASKNHNRSSK
uniref:Uncharacterized protein n=1 Tax=Rhizophora mucronata TaxID=61149 RepID=A0A2P2Q7D7_RHIMU